MFNIFTKFDTFLMLFLYNTRHRTYAARTVRSTELRSKFNIDVVLSFHSV